MSPPSHHTPPLAQESHKDLSSAPPFGLADIRAAIPDHCWERNAWKSAAYLVRDVAFVFGLAAGAYTLNTW
jgi:omega-3 fatty acid desaturase (delta-15 desaturase)